MNRPFLHLSLLLLWLVLPSQYQNLSHAQSSGKRDKSSPETSLSDSFNPKELAKLAVIVSVDERNRSLQSDQQRLVEDMFVETLLQKGHVVVARSDLKSVLKEQELSKSGLTEANAAAVGKLLNVPAVLVVRINEFLAESQRDPKKNAQILMARATVGARLIGVESGALWWQGSHTISDAINIKSELLLVLAKVTDKLSKAFPEKNAENNSHFDPKDIQKLALIMVGDSHSRSNSFGRIGSSRLNDNALDQQRLVEDKIGILIGNKGYNLVSRSDLQSVMQEKRFQQSGLTEENVSDFGKLLNVPAVMVVRITECATETHSMGSKSHSVAMAALGARLVSVETGRVLWCKTWIEKQEVGGKLDAPQVLTKVAKKIGDAFPDQKSSKKASTGNPE